VTPRDSKRVFSFRAERGVISDWARVLNVRVRALSGRVADKPKDTMSAGLEGSSPQPLHPDEEQSGQDIADHLDVSQTLDDSTAVETEAPLLATPPTCRAQHGTHSLYLIYVDNDGRA
jgi:hypothetical protein